MSKLRTRGVERLATLDDLVRDFRARLGPEGPLEAGYFEWLRQSSSLQVAINRAVDSRKPDGKMHNHQSRVPQSVKDAYKRSLKVVAPRIRVIKDFDQLLGLCDRRKVQGIGPVTVYDVAIRIGVYLGLEPDVTYLHAGVRDGAKALGLNVDGKEYLTRKELPRPLRRLTANEVEDFLCVYREHLPRMRKEVVKEMLDRY